MLVRRQVILSQSGEMAPFSRIFLPNEISYFLHFPQVVDIARRSNYP